MKHAFLLILLLGTVFFCAADSFGQARPERYWFIAKSVTPKKQTLEVNKVTACMLGDTLKPPVTTKFKAEIVATTFNMAGLLNAGTCDVGLVFDDRPDGFDRIKKDQVGFDIYKIAGNTLVLAVEATDVASWIAVGSKTHAGQNSLNKKEITGCGDSPLRGIFRPNARVWKNWRQAYVKFEDLKTPAQKEQENVLLWGCDVWIFSPDDYKRFTKTYGSGHPLFNVSPESDELTRKK